MAFRKVARAAEVPPGEAHFFVAGGKPVVISNWDGRLWAHYGLCPHQRFPMEGATLWDNLLTCPWHNYQYDVATGENLYPMRVYPGDLRRQLEPLKSFPVEIRNGEVWVDMDCES